ncbi:hypothetical protein GCM10009710_05580 [Aeromicrobium alkaliterrae]|uniref:Uncharacterized protein n=1 Tax=Aeromicrobium alkaliterrae TaxID=302168 RepID=A0ABP4VLK3_9ACTN
MLLERAPVARGDVDAVDVGEDLLHVLGERRVELRAHDAGVLRGAAGEPGRADAGAGAELGERAGAAGGQGREQPAGLVARRGDEAALPGEVQGAADELGDVEGRGHVLSLARASPGKPRRLVGETHVAWGATRHIFVTDG